MVENLKLLLLIILPLLISNCGGAKYNYHFQKGRSLGFSRGTWILNDISTDLIKIEMGSFATAPSYGSRVKSNEAATKIRIYDLNKQELLSESSVHGIAKKIKNLR